MGTKTHSLLDDRAKVSFLSASRMKRELVLLEPKNLGRIILDKVPGMSRGTKANKSHWGVAGWHLAPWWFLSYLSVVLCPVPLPPTASMKCFLQWGSQGCMCFVLLCLFLAERLLGFKVCGTERRRSSKIFTMPSHAEWLDMLSQGAPSSMLGLEMSPWGCEEAHSTSNSCCCLRSHNLHPNTPSPLATRSGQWI